MSRDATLLLALGMLTAAALAVGVSGWMLVVRDRRREAHATVAGPSSLHEAHGEE